MEWGYKGEISWPKVWYDHCCRTCSSTDAIDHGPWCEKKEKASEKKKRRAEKKGAEKKEAEKNIEAEIHGLRAS